MRSNKGITLTSLVIYMAVATLVIGSMALLGTHFYSNAELIKEPSEYVVEYNKFNMFFIEDVKTNKTATINGTTITFEDGTKYEYKGNSIYRNNNEIAKNVQSVQFTADTYVVSNTTKNLITVNLNIGTSEKNYEKQIEYVLRYW